MSSKDIPVATAVPAQDNPPAIAPSVIYPTLAEPLSNSDNGRYGVCRKCRRVFERPPGVNDGQAQYYRCPECDNERWPDMIISSCVLS